MMDNYWYFKDNCKSSVDRSKLYQKRGTDVSYILCIELLEKGNKVITSLWTLLKCSQERNSLFIFYSPLALVLADKNRYSLQLIALFILIERN